MPKYEDGSYQCLPAPALIAKAMAGKCQMNYTRAAVGQGALPEGVHPKSLTEPPGYVMDAKIAGITNPVDGECKVTLQVCSDDVEMGFNATGILLYAQDPDKGEVPYTYLLMENGPEWIRPASSAVGKIAVFDVIAVVGGVDNVTAVLDPDAFATVAYVEKRLTAAGGGSYVAEIIIPAEGWTAGERSIYTLDLPLEASKEASLPDVKLDETSRIIAGNCGLSQDVYSFDGYLRFTAQSVPAAAMTGSLILHGGAASSEISYKLPVAARTTLGGVKASDSFNVDQDGTPHIYAEISPANLATDEEMDDIFNNIFGK